MFDIQRFGDNDTVTSSSELKTDYAFSDGDTRIVNIPNPRTDLTSSEVAVYDAWIVANQPIIGDRTGAAVIGIAYANRQDQVRRKLDLTDE